MCLDDASLATYYGQHQDLGEDEVSQRAEIARGYDKAYRIGFLQVMAGSSHFGNH